MFHINVDVMQTDFSVSDVFAEGQCHKTFPKRQEIKISGVH